jgi:G3E family GTPase
MSAALPVYLLTGFLGAGKTTLLARLVRRPELADTAVIVNEFGEVGLDHRLVARGEEEDNVVLLDSGCLCCAAGDKLTETLTELFHRRARGEVPPFARVVIETTGLADPGPILRSLMADRFSTERFAVAGVIACVDAELGVSQLERFQESRLQAAMADRFVVTKTDRATPEATAALIARLRLINPRAEVLTAVEGDIDPERLLAPATPTAPPPAHDHHHDHGDHTGGVQTVFLAIPHPIGWEAYAAMVRYFQTSLGERLLRTKGLVRIEGEPGLQVVQGVQLLFAPPRELVGAEAGATTGLVLIGEELAPASLIADLAGLGVRAAIR